ncbi:MAG: FCD domain-containing protein [Devosia sp.]|nr:FCD domain-containing protein [Devosia sp.]
MIKVRRKVGITIFYPDMKFVGNTSQLRGLLEKEGAAQVRQLGVHGLDPAHAGGTLPDHLLVQANPAMSDYRLPVKQLESEFHESFISAFGNEQVDTIYARLAQKMYVIRLHNLEAVGPANTVQSMREHLAVVGALEAGDVEAAVDGRPPPQGRAAQGADDLSGFSRASSRAGARPWTINRRS